MDREPGLFFFVPHITFSASACAPGCGLSISSCSFRLELNTMPASNLLFEDLVNQLMLLDDAETFELRRHNVEAVHRAAAAGDILNLSHRQSFSLIR